jgi:hypothetical protein
MCADHGAADLRRGRRADLKEFNAPALVIYSAESLGSGRIIIDVAIIALFNAMLSLLMYSGGASTPPAATASGPHR